jgi:hypothetical protein
MAASSRRAVGSGMLRACGTCWRGSNHQHSLLLPTSEEFDHGRRSASCANIDRTRAS